MNILVVLVLLYSQLIILVKYELLIVATFKTCFSFVILKPFQKVCPFFCFDFVSFPSCNKSSLIFQLLCLIVQCFKLIVNRNGFITTCTYCQLDCFWYSSLCCALEIDGLSQWFWAIDLKLWIKCKSCYIIGRPNIIYQRYLSSIRHQNTIRVNNLKLCNRTKWKISFETRYYSIVQLFDDLVLLISRHWKSLLNDLRSCPIHHFWWTWCVQEFLVSAVDVHRDLILIIVRIWFGFLMDPKDMCKTLNCFISS